MKRAVVIGCPGAGKTTFAQKLNKRTGLPLFHLDSIFFRPDRSHISRDEFDRRLSEILGLNEWIIDGNYPRTMERRIQMCDTVFLFDLPPEACVQGIVSRLGISRPDMPWTAHEPDPELMQKINGFPDKELPAVRALLDKYKADKQIIIFKSRAQADQYLDMYFNILLQYKKSAQ